MLVFPAKMSNKYSYRSLFVVTLSLVIQMFIVDIVNAQNEKNVVDQDNKLNERKYLALPNSTFLTVHTQLMHYYDSGPFFNAKQLSYGLKVGTMKNTGWFLGMMTNFNFQGAFNICEESQIDQFLVSNSFFEGLIGITGRYCAPLSFHFGIGYFYQSFNHKMLNGQWGHFLEDVCHGPVASAGFMFHIKGFVLTAECVTNYNILSQDKIRAFGVGAKLGLGFCVPNVRDSKKKKTQNQVDIVIRPFVPVTSVPENFDKSQFVTPDIYFSQMQGKSLEYDVDTLVANEANDKARPQSHQYEQSLSDTVNTFIENAMSLDADSIPKSVDTAEVRNAVTLLVNDTTDVFVQGTEKNNLPHRTIEDLIKRDEPCGELTITDFDHNSYGTVLIGRQCWMRENIRTTHYSDGTDIPLAFIPDSTHMCRYYPGGDSANVAKYGFLYNWLAVVKQNSLEESQTVVVQGICPLGWHVPDDSEWTELTDFVSNQDDWICNENKFFVAKAISNIQDWSESDSLCAIGNRLSDNNMSGFSVLPAGAYYGQFGLLGKGAWFWTSTRSAMNNAIDRFMLWDEPIVRRNDTDSIAGGFSVRCVKD